MPKQKPKGDYRTPPDFYAAVCKKFGTPQIDLAATADNTLCAEFYDAQNTQYWNWPTDRDQLCWLNPPFGDIAPWARKAARARCRILMLIPASVGSNWFLNYVLPHADIYLLHPRLSFSRKAPRPGEKIPPYPKDLILAFYNPPTSAPPAVFPWRWNAPEGRGAAGGARLTDAE